MTGDGDPTEWGYTDSKRGVEFYHPPHGPGRFTPYRRRLFLHPSSGGRAAVTGLRARWNRLDTEEQRAVFIVGVIAALLHLAGLAVRVVTGSWGMLALVGGWDAIFAFIGGLVWLAKRVIPDDKPASRAPRVFCATCTRDQGQLHHEWCHRRGTVAR